MRSGNREVSRRAGALGRYAPADFFSLDNTVGHDNAVGSSSSRSSEPLGSPAERRDAAHSGETLAKVKAAALAEVPNATIVRIETDADGHAAYEAHVVKADGAPATVYVDKQFDVVRVESR
jgi:uncharacterized membrane protein YkoI